MNPEALLEKHFLLVDSIILSRQGPITGLLPASTAVNAHGDYTDAWVRDNVYSIMGVWGLSLAYKRHAPDHHRCYYLRKSVVKLMRGLLMAMMRQSDRVERFKTSLDAGDALHAKYGTSTGLAVVGDYEWGHLQLDATSLFLLMIAQMTASGLRLIYTIDEVNFVQNLVHYISRTYCTPDYGIWERGNKINSGATEINGSSVGMAKAALEALNGFNLFGNVVSQESVIHVVASDVARSRFMLHGLLPRESRSKETDAALLSIIGYPAYAIEDADLVVRTREKIVSKLAGRYGCKRFLRDGHQSVLEDSSRLHYEAKELKKFEHIESEWPLFFTYLLLDALMRSDKEAAKMWREKLEPLFVERDGMHLLPELYIVPAESIEAERAHPSSQQRYANENLPLVWAQSLFMLSDMIFDGILLPSDIDPLRRRDRIGHSRSTHPLVAILAQNASVKQRLLDRGIFSETPEEVAPVRIMHAAVLSKVHTQLGRNDKLHLKGRPSLVARTITSARLYLLEGKEVLFLPYYFNPQGFYFGFDNRLLVEHFEASLKFLTQHWDQAGQPLLAFMVRDDMLQNDNAVIEMLNRIQTQKCAGVTLKHAPLRQLLSTAAKERIDNLHGIDLEYENARHTDSEISHEWAMLRRDAQESNAHDVRIEDALIDIIIQQKRLAVGRAYSDKATFFKPLDTAHIIAVINEFCGNNPAEGILTQEIMLHLSHLVRNEPELFKNILTLRTWYFVQLLVGHISRESHIPMGEAYERLLELAPYTIYEKLRRILHSYQHETTQMIAQENLHVTGISNLSHDTHTELVDERGTFESWTLWRHNMGMLSQVSKRFYKDVWYLLQQCQGVVIGDKYGIQNRLGSEVTLSTTPGEQSFELMVDTLLQNIEAPDYRQLNIEAIGSLSRLFQHNPQMHINDDLILDVLIGHAVRIAWEKEHGSDNYAEQKGRAWKAMYNRSLIECDHAFIEAFSFLLLHVKEAG